jgi:hypothetical protein
MSNKSLSNDTPSDNKISDEELSDSDNDEQVEEMTEVKKKLSIEDYHEAIFKCLEKLDDLDDEINSAKDEYLLRLKQINNSKKKVKRNLKNIKKKIPKSLENAISKAKKEKRQRKGPNNGGFVKVKKVPQKLVDYLGLDDGAELSRPQVVHLINEKFKKDGLRDGKRVLLSKEVAKSFGKKVDKKTKKYIIEFSGLQTFVADIYKEEESSNNLVV